MFLWTLCGMLPVPMGARSLMVANECWQRDLGFERFYLNRRLRPWFTAYSEVILPTGGAFCPRLEGYAPGFPLFLRIESPRISMRWALCTSRSRMHHQNIDAAKPRQ